jgi:transcription antitermination factor NusA-like protein
MINTINMEGLRHLNLFSKITKIQTRFHFSYNETLMFCVPKSKIFQALGKDNENLRKLSGIVKKRIRVLPKPRGVEDAKAFIEQIISPVSFKEIEITSEEIIITAGPQNKAALLGRNKRRLLEMQKIVKDFFGLEYRVQ